MASAISVWHSPRYKTLILTIARKRYISVPSRSSCDPAEPLARRSVHVGQLRRSMWASLHSISARMKADLIPANPGKCGKNKRLHV